VDGTNDAAMRARIRALQIDDRISKLRERKQSIVEAGVAKGSTPEQAASAAHYVRLALLRATEAAERSASAYEHAARAHDRAAAALEEMSAAGAADCVSYRERARRHRASAAADRRAARAYGGQ
jgi:hypothetical protein